MKQRMVSLLLGIIIGKKHQKAQMKTTRSSEFDSKKHYTFSRMLGRILSFYLLLLQNFIKSSEKMFCKIILISRTV